MQAWVDDYCANLSSKQFRANCSDKRSQSNFRHTKNRCLPQIVRMPLKKVTFAVLNLYLCILHTYLNTVHRVHNPVIMKGCEKPLLGTRLGGRAELRPCPEWCCGYLCPALTLPWWLDLGLASSLWSCLAIWTFAELMASTTGPPLFFTYR